MSAFLPFQPSVAQMLEDKSFDGDAFDGTNRPPHPDSLDGRNAEWCKLTAEEQVWYAEEKLFEQRLKAEARRRAQAGWSGARINRWVNHHRLKWAQTRAPRKPEAVSRRETSQLDRRVQSLHWLEEAER